MPHSPLLAPSNYHSTLWFCEFGYFREFLRYVESGSVLFSDWFISLSIMSWGTFHVVMLWTLLTFLSWITFHLYPFVCWWTLQLIPSWILWMALPWTKGMLMSLRILISVPLGKYPEAGYDISTVDPWTAAGLVLVGQLTHTDFLKIKYTVDPL